MAGRGFGGPGTEIARFMAVLGLDASQFNAGIASAQASATGLNSALLGGAGLASGFLAAQSAIRIFDDVIMGSAEGVISFETAMTGLAKTVEPTAEEFDAISDAIKTMATEEIPRGRDELARIGQIAGQLGVRGTEDLTHFIETIAKMDVATDLTSENAAVSMARLSAIFHRPIEDVEELASAIVKLGNTEAAFEQEIIDIAQRIGPSAEIVGMSEAMTLGMAATLPAVGLRPELAGTAIQRLLLEIDTMVSEGEDKLDLLALISQQTSEEFAKNWEENTDEAVFAFLEGLDALGNLGTAALDGLDLSQQRTLRTLFALSSNVEKLKINTAAAGAELQHATELDREAERAFGTTAAAIDIFQNNIRDLADAIGGPLVDALNEVLPGLTTFIQHLTGRDVLEPNLLLGALGNQQIGGVPVQEPSGAQNADLLTASLGPLVAGKLVSALFGVGAGATVGLAGFAGMIPETPEFEPTLFEQAAAAFRDAGVESFSDANMFETAGMLAARGIIESFTNEFNRIQLRFTGLEGQLAFADLYLGQRGLRAGVPEGLISKPVDTRVLTPLMDEELGSQFDAIREKSGEASDGLSEWEREVQGLLDSMKAGSGGLSDLEKELRRLEQLAESTEERRARQMVEAFARGDEAEVRRLSNTFDKVDAELERLAPMIEERFGLLPVEVADIFDKVRTEIEDGKDKAILETNDLIDFLLARRLGQGADPNTLFRRTDGEALTINNTFGDINIGTGTEAQIISTIGTTVATATRRGVESVV